MVSYRAIVVTRQDEVSHAGYPHVRSGIGQECRLHLPKQGNLDEPQRSSGTVGEFRYSNRLALFDLFLRQAVLLLMVRTIEELGRFETLMPAIRSDALDALQ